MRMIYEVKNVKFLNNSFKFHERRSRGQQQKSEGRKWPSLKISRRSMKMKSFYFSSGDYRVSDFEKGKVEEKCLKDFSSFAESFMNIKRKV